MDTAPVSLSQAAAILGTTQEAIRKRIKRGILRAEKGEGGRWLVYMEADTAHNISGHSGESGHMEADTAIKPPSCAQCSQLMIERAALSATLEAKTEQINAMQEQIINLQRERDNWQLQALTTIQAITSSNSPLTLPGAVGQIPERAEGEGVGLWARLKGFMKVGRPGRS